MPDQEIVVEGNLTSTGYLTVIISVSKVVIRVEADLNSVVDAAYLMTTGGVVGDIAWTIVSDFAASPGTDQCTTVKRLVAQWAKEMEARRTASMTEKDIDQLVMDFAQRLDKEEITLVIGDEE